MLDDWTTEPKFGLCNTAMEKLTHEIVGVYKHTYYGQQPAKADREAKRVAIARCRVVEEKALEELAAELASQQATWAEERATLLQDKDNAE